MLMCINRPFEYYPTLGDVQLERAYFLMMFAFWVVSPNKGFVSNRLHGALVAFSVALAVCWLASPYRDLERCSTTVENYLKVALFYVLVVTSVRDEKGLRTLLAMFLLSESVYIGHYRLDHFNWHHRLRHRILRMFAVDVYS